MADKTLRLIFNGISTLSPGPPLNGDRTPERAFVLMAANPTKRPNAWEGTVEEHAPFVYVPASLVAGTAPAAGATVADEKLGPCYVYYLANARVSFDPA